MTSEIVEPQSKPPAPPLLTARVRKHLTLLEKEAERCERRGNLLLARALDFRNRAAGIAQTHEKP